MERSSFQIKQLLEDKIEYDQVKIEVREQELNAETEVQKQQLTAKIKNGRKNSNSN